MDSATRVQIHDEAACISLCANALWKDMNQSFLSPATVWQNGLFSLCAATSLREGKPAVKTLSYSAHG